MKTLLEVTPILPFTSDFDFFFEKDTLIFTIFINNPMISDEVKHERLTSIYHDLNKFLHPWLKFYTWGYKPCQIELAQYKDNNQTYNYIFGCLQFAECINDEWLLTSLIIKYFKGQHCKVKIDLEDVMMHFFDQHGEFSLIESFNHIPDWCGPDNSFNRVWFNGRGELLLIPGKYPVSHNIENLKLQEALLFLNKYNYYIDRVSLQNAARHLWDTKLNHAIEESLRLCVTTTAQIDRDLAFWMINLMDSQNNINCNNDNDDYDYDTDNVIVRSFESFVNENDGFFESSSQLLVNFRDKFQSKNQKLLNKLIFERKKGFKNDLVKLQIRLPFIWYYICKVRFEQRGYKSTSNDDNYNDSLEKYLGKALGIGLRSAIESDIEIENRFLKIAETFLGDGLNGLIKSSGNQENFHFKSVSDNEINRYNNAQLEINCRFQEGLIKDYHLINAMIKPMNFEEFTNNVYNVFQNELQEKESTKLNDELLEQEENEMIERVKKFINEENVKLDNSEKNENDTDSQRNNNKFKMDIEKEIDEFYNDDSEGCNSENNLSDNDALGHFNKEQLGLEMDSVNEDDFFEFFLTNALKIPKEELKNYRADSNNDKKFNYETKSKIDSKVKEKLNSGSNDKIVSGDDRKDIDDDSEEYIDYFDYVDDDIPEEEMSRLISRMKQLSAQMNLSPSSTPKEASLEPQNE